ncbi:MULTISPECIES: SDH family Clp fold serine proteinase [unclassified Yoonia]|uniref:SDH family Clp fold serine proteinase n=1 Tax=unclassified Yoonia TaxID=2629118 RepID=UPI002AFFD49D|nr:MULTISPECIES: S49 family peptidase [unclassified Yoonia]
MIAYYSGYLQQPPHPSSSIDDFDMNGFMAVIHNLDRSRGLDLLIQTPGGSIEATRALVEYLYSMFGKDIRVIVPHCAFSAGTMIACASKTIIMGKHSSLGPTDPQVRGVPAMGVIEEIKTALDEVRADPLRQIVWQEVFRQFPPAFISNCERAIEGTKQMVMTWLAENMFAGEEDSNAKAAATIAHLMSFKETTEHGHHFLRRKCSDIGLNIVGLEDDQKLQELVLSVHHSYVASFARVKTIKFIENSSGASWNVSAD